MQVDARLARKYEGTGLGLVLVARMVELHGGSIAVESTLGQGSRFTIALPWEEAPGEGPQIAQLPHATKGTAAFVPLSVPQRARPRVLLAEHNEANIARLTGYLESEGYQVVIARTGIEAVARARDVTPAVILIDIQMPELDGLEAMRLIRADANLATIPIIALAALVMPGDRERCLAAGAGEYLTKPIGLKALVRAIDMHLRRPAASMETT
jgi:CheY-like chemotaxis protein